MKRVVCSACGLVNLEKFVTFPHCAGCGALLSTAATQKSSLWRQPLRAPMWATVVALCCAAVGFLGISIARETGRPVERPLIVYAQIPRQMTAGKPALMQFVLDTMSGDGENLDEFESVQLRISHGIDRDFEVVGLMPAPDHTFSVGAGTTFEYERLRRDEAIQLLLSARRPGQHRLSLSVFVIDFTPFHFRRMVPVKAQTIYPSIANGKRAFPVAPKNQRRGEN